jgi:hypothetical protein
MKSTRTRRVLLRLACAAFAIAVGGRHLPTVLAQSHWESYKSRNPTPSVDQHLSDPALIGAIDLHAHSGPDAYGRQWDAFEVARLAKERGMRGIVLKNHWTETAGQAYLVRKYAGVPGFEVFGAASLDTPTGGLNPMTVRYLADVEGHLARIVWLPTHDVEQEVKAAKNQPPRPFVVVSSEGKLVPEIFEILDLVKQFDLTLATGHVTPAEAAMIIPEAKKRGIERIIVTHPSLAGNNMWTVDQLKTAAKDAYIEFTAGSLSREGEGQKRAFDAIRAVTPARAFASSDSGLIGTPNHPDALAMAAKALRAGGFSEHDLNLMFKDNPAILVKLPVMSGSQ